MKLSRQTNKAFLIFSVSIFLGAGITLYIILSYIISSETDDKLFETASMIELKIRKGCEISSIEPIINVKKLDISENNYKIDMRSTLIKDTLITESGEDEPEPYREIRIIKNINGEYFEIVVRNSLIESGDLLAVITLPIGAILILTLMLLFYINNRISGKLWHPFYKGLEVLKNLTFENQPEKPLLHNSKISEFKEFNDVILLLIERIRKSYNSLKEFTENAAHEMQTPLAIIQGKFDLLIQNARLSQADTVLISSVSEEVKRLSRLNKTLFLLTKIENRQFAEISSVNLTEDIEKHFNNYSDLIETKQITVSFNLASEIIIIANPALMELLINNLISNSIKHNIEGGKIIVELAYPKLKISNTGLPLESNPGELFERFHKGRHSSSLGLGLSIVKQICDYYGWRISYLTENEWHNIEILM
ncbi:MAG: hypothetical protein QG635_409 [Bacteroidota bacterium]|nr:hypothetical protein [Bacteroidota bacterium]